jgi:hypothetical protein
VEHRERPSTRRTVGAVLVAVSLVGLVAVVGGIVTTALAPVARAQTSPYFTLSVTPTQGLTNGEAMTVTVTRTPAGTTQGLQILAMATGWCTADPQFPGNLGTFAPGTPFAALPKITAPNVHCTTVNHPLDSTLVTQTGYSPPTNSTGNYPTLNATVAAQATGGTTLQTGTTLICDASHPCSFAVLVYVQKTGTYSTSVFMSVPVTYQPPSINTDCGGAAPGQLTTIAPDRLGQQITSWTLGGCSSGLDGGKAVTQNVASGQSDASALGAFADGNADLAYSGVGYGATPVFTPTTQRPYVAVPIALNAVVLAHIQSRAVTNVASLNVFGKLPQLRVTDAQAAQLVAGGPDVTAALWKNTLGKALVFDNPTLGYPSWYFSPTKPITYNSAHSTGSINTGVAGASQPQATTLFATTFFHTVTPHALVSRTGQTLGVTSDFGTVNPPYAIFATTGTLLFAKAVSPGIGQGWALTDADTAAATWGGLSVAALQTPGSIGAPSANFVAPTVASMQAAVPQMIPQPDGTLEPNPDAGASNGVAAYPLTYVEYAIAPTQPLLNANCSARTKSQQNLVDWLTYLTGAGQSELGGGLAPLTPALQRQARQAIAQVGKATTTGPCAPVTAPGSSPAAGAAGAASTPGGTGSSSGSTAASGGTSGFGTSAFSTGAGGSFGTTAAGATTTAQLGSATKTGATGGGGNLKQVSVDLAGFKHDRVSSLILPVLGVLFLIVFLPGLALMVADGSFRGRLNRVASRGGTDGSPPTGAP